MRLYPIVEQHGVFATAHTIAFVKLHLDASCLIVSNGLLYRKRGLEVLERLVLVTGTIAPVLTRQRAEASKRGPSVIGAFVRSASFNHL
jgi:hypothetical protein